MKKRFIFLAILLVALAFGLSACNSNPTDDSNLREKGYFSATLNCNGGNIGGRSSVLIYALPNSPITRNSEIPTPAAPSEALELEGWFFGEVIDGKVVFSNERWDFSTSYMGNSDIVLYAKWVNKLSFTLNMATKEGESESRILAYVSNFVDDNAKKLNKPVYDPEWEGYTFIDYFADPEFSTPLQFPLAHNNQETHTLYARFIEGSYTVARTAKDFSVIRANTKLYLLNDIDMAGETWHLYSHPSFTGEINGDTKPNGEGMVISNLTSEVSRSGNYLTYENFGIFGFMAGATVKNVQFVNCSFTLTLPAGTAQSMVYVGLLAGKIEANTTFSNVVVSGSVTVRVLNNNTNVFTETNGLTGRVASGVDISGVSTTINTIKTDRED